MLKKFVHYLSNKKAQVFLVGCFLVVLINSYSQENNKNLYLIAGHIDSNLPGNYFSYLFRYNNKTLDTIALLSNDSTHLRFIKAYHDHRKVVILKDGYIYNDNYILQIISMDNPKDIITLNMGNGNDLFEKNLVSYDDSLYYIFDKEDKYMGVNLNSLSTYVFNGPEILWNAIIKGDMGGLMDIYTHDYILLNHNKYGDSLYFSKYYKNYFLNLKIPDSLICVDERYYSLQTKNANYIVIWNNNSKKNQLSKIGWSNLIIYDKKNQKWFSLKIKGNVASFVNFNKLLAGWVIEEYDDKNDFEWISPDEKDRKKKHNSLGATFDERALDFAVYMPGILYLYNLETKQYIEWETGQGDSEILLVQDEIVYYRVADKIYKSPIIEGKSIGKPELIIQDERIHDIHWAFITEK